MLLILHRLPLHLFLVHWLTYQLAKLHSLLRPLHYRPRATSISILSLNKCQALFLLELNATFDISDHKNCFIYYRLSLIQYKDINSVPLSPEVVVCTADVASTPSSSPPPSSVAPSPGCPPEDHSTLASLSTPIEHV